MLRSLMLCSYLVLSIFFVAPLEAKTDSIISNWTEVAKLPLYTHKGQPTGISAAYTGMIGSYLVIAGGANFPNGHPYFDGASKHYHDNIYVYDLSNEQFKLVATGKLPMPMGYGATVSKNNSLLLVGGKDNQQTYNTVIALTLDENHMPQSQLVATLPFTWSDGAADLHADSLYLFAGMVDEKISNQVCKFSFARGQCDVSGKIPALPASPRTQFPAIAINGQFMLFGGINSQSKSNNFALTDAYSFDYKTAKWRVLPKTKLNNEDFTLAGGSALRLTNKKILVLGGINKSVFNNAVLKLNTLQGSKLEQFKLEYFSMPISAFNFSRKQVVFDTHTMNWSALQQDVPFAGGAGPLQTAQYNKMIYWISGEVKAVQRSPYIYQAKVQR
ncbi:Kelch repeat-containing protein [Pseudoalteromonas sp. SCQQ13]|uniref:Kelch repeat-containing protein n=1 Tax=Pseudoalteromonas sp. SCQQ13 TaxID=2792066 RepID=UPI0018CDAB3A|nr:kelch repeat-containing protein [Pseudoalteromonas sp. SCQQ13]MBH0092229.1 hypothetical protein [Pseudoalteromonas sp. SCQQ13]